MTNAARIAGKAEEEGIKEERLSAARDGNDKNSGMPPPRTIKRPERFPEKTVAQPEMPPLEIGARGDSDGMPPILYLTK